MWNDASILADNVGSPQVLRVLSTLNHAITIVVRTDGSGTSQVFTSALDAISPAGFAITPGGLVANSDGSFHDQVTPNGPSPSPFWCGPLTDELQYITVTGCNGGTSSLRTIQFRMIDINFVPQNVSIDCGLSASSIAAQIVSATSLNIHVTVTNLTVGGGVSTLQVEVGYRGIQQRGKNWYNPVYVSSPAGMTVKVKAKQEGGYLNTVTTCTGNPSTLQTMTVWIKATSTVKFTLAWIALSGLSQNTTSLSYAGTDLSARILAAVNAVSPGAVTSAVQILHGTWTEYRIVFASSTQGSFSSLKAITKSGGPAYVYTFLDYGNYPCFYDSAHPRGYGGSGRYTCYRRQSNFTAYSYYTGSSNLGVVAEVLARPYSIGYSVLENAISQNLPTASMINKAGATVVASSQSVGFAIMDKGGNLNSLFQANLADGTSSNVWPISGFTYFVIRKNSHVDPGNCKRRSAAMEYLYNFYNSKTVADSAQKLGFAALPEFIASIILKQLVDHAMCDNGQYALARHRVIASPLLSASVFQHTLDAYISAYTAVDPSAVWNIGYSAVSASIWNQYSVNPRAVSGAFTMFPSRADKISHYNRTDVLTSSFAHVAVVMLYHLNGYSNINAATGNTGKNGPLRLTADIIGGILAGRITVWNDTLIQAANSATKSFLPNIPIVVVVRGLSCDTNSLILRFLTEKSPVFAAAYIAAGATSMSQFNFSTNIPSSRLILTTSNTRLDSYVAALDGAFGYYLQNAPPASAVASYCYDPTCSQLISDPTMLSSISVCETDTNTVLNPRPQLYTYDLMSSTAPGCYPIVGTVDYSLLATTDKGCSAPNTTYSTVLKDRIRFGSWLFSSPVIVQPLASNYVLATKNTLRDSTFGQVCEVTCNGEKYGYEYCGYRDCSYASGDYTQMVSECDPETEKKSVTYKLAPGSTCIQNPATIPPSVIFVGCSDVLKSYQYGMIATAMSMIGMIVCAFVMIFVVVNRKEKIIKKSQPIFIYIFISGAFLMNLSILAFIGPNDDSNCLLRPWSIDISTTIMFAPLLMKLHRIDMLFRSSKKLKKTMIRDHTVALQVLGLVSIDVFILFLWTFIDRPRGLMYKSTAGGLYAPIELTVCSTNLSSPFEQAMVAWKAMLLAAGVYKSICTWDMPSDIAEVKHFFLAIYNVSVVGGAMYFFSMYGSSSAGSFVILRCVGIFVSATLPVLIIMVPKFTVIQYKNITGKNLWAASKSIVDMISSNSKSHSHIEVAAIVMKDTTSMKRLLTNAPRVLPVGASDVMDAADTPGVGSCKTFCSSGSRKQSSKALLNTFGCADRMSSDILRTGNSTYKIPTNADADDEGISETIGLHTTAI